MDVKMSGGGVCDSKKRDLNEVQPIIVLEDDSPKASKQAKLIDGSAQKVTIPADQKPSELVSTNGGTLSAKLTPQSEEV